MSLPDYAWQIDTDLDPAVLRSVLDFYRPYRIEVNFSSGFSTRTYGDQVLYSNPVPLAKLHYFESDLEIDCNSRILDVGCNLGYFGHYFVKNRGVRSVVGIEFDKRICGAAMLLRDIAGLTDSSLRLIGGDFGDPVAQAAVARCGPYDVVLFLGSLNAIGSFTAALRMLPTALRPGGTLVLEYTAFASAERLCRFHPEGEGFNTPWETWTFSEPFIDDLLSSIGLTKLKQALDWSDPGVLGEYRKITSLYRMGGDR
jgi:SAM-dependent methyltransferase